MKSKLIKSLLLFISFQGIACAGINTNGYSYEEESPEPRKPFEFFHGFYIGEGLGMAFNMSNIDLHSHLDTDHVNTGPQEVSIDHSSNMDLYQNRIYGELYGGWGYQFENGFHVGARVGVNFSSFEIVHKEKTSSFSPSNALVKYTNQEVEVRSKIHSVDYTLDAKFGWAFKHDTMIYVLIGGALNRPEILLDLDSMFEFQSVAGTQSMMVVEERETSDNYRINLHYGIGVEQKLFEFLGSNVLYTYTNYSEREASIRGVSNQVQNILTLGYSSKLKSQIKRHTVSMGLAYHF